MHLRKATEHESVYSEDLVRHLVNAVIVISARNIAIIKPQDITPNTDIRLLQILDYIQEHIRRPELLRIAVIAENFGLSPTYLGSYFRKQCDESIQHYISSYRIRLIEHRLRFSDKRVHEIADEFGFADESHINKFFKRHKGLSLKGYKYTLSAT
ncbi:AraC family transcriptional regulator [Empedobacter brevis]|uniref:helix-turn-helix domain-containing protein n=1 Tax=Empedobacter brevis TaxID=247 RepID=UPI002FE11A80